MRRAALSLAGRVSSSSHRDSRDREAADSGAQPSRHQKARSGEILFQTHLLII